MKLVRLKETLALALPERGMPIILAQFSEIGNAAGWESVLARSNRINGMDVQPASAVYLPAGGMGHFGWPAIAGHRQGRDFIFEPSGWRVTQEDDSLVLEAQDSCAEILVRLHFRLTPALTMQTEIRNLGASDYTLDRCMAASLLLAAGARDIISFRGKWGQEFQETIEPAGNALWVLENRKGRTSHDKFPGLVILDRLGQGFAMHLAWSGNHISALDRLDDGRSLLHMGALFEPGEIILRCGQSYVSPKAYAVHSPSGDRNVIAAAFRASLRHDVLCWPGGAMKPRPVLLNTWEGNYFKHNVERLKQQATAAAALGIERFVLDDGWFGRRDDDTSSLGDWFVDTRKYPDGLNVLAHHVTGLGLEFGLWFEPEMVNRNSELYRAHPDWVLQVDGRALLESRQQLVLDLTRAEVSDAVFARIDEILAQCPISYIKWDMNRDLTHAAGVDGQAKIAAQTRAVYALMERVRRAHPAVEIESCSSGGGRADFGVLAYSHRVWISDCTDALERLAIQRGARQFLAPEIMGCHISASPNHQTERRHSLAFRAIVAFFGHLGVELDPLSLTESDRQDLAGWIALHKTLRHVLHAADAESFDLPVTDGRYVFGVKRWDAKDKSEHMIVAVAQATHPKCEQPMPLCLPVSQGHAEYFVREIGPVKAQFARAIPSQRRILDGELAVSGALIANHGLPLPQLYPESAILLELKSSGTRHG